MQIQLKISMGASFLFLLIELILNLHRRSVSGSGTRQADKGSLSLIWITITVCLTLGFNLGEHGKWSVADNFIGIAGILLYCSGLVVRLMAVRQLSEAFTVDVAYKEGQKLRTEGVYRLVRHPSYLGGLMTIMGISMGMGTLLSIIVVTVPVFLAFNYRMIVEEKLLLDSFGDSYREYQSKTRRIIPYIY